MKVSCKFLGAVAVIALLAGQASAQERPVTRYGEEDKAKSPTERAAEKDAERAYQRSLGNIPAQKTVDPWGIARGDSAPPKPATASPAKSKADTGAKPQAKSADTKAGGAAAR